MKKQIIAAAVAAAFAVPAMAQVTVYGTVGATLETVKEGGLDSETRNGTAANDYYKTTRVGLSASEDLGGGMKAFAVLEGDLNGMGGQIGAAGAAAQGNVFNRLANVGISGGFGTVSFGRQNDAIKDIEGLGNPNNLSDTYTITDVGDRTANLLKYVSPSVGGIKFTAAVSNDGVDAEGNGGAPAATPVEHTSYSISGSLGGIQFAVGMGKETQAAVNQETTRIGLGYNLSSSTSIGLAYTDNTAAAGQEGEQWMGSVVHNMGNWTIQGHLVSNTITGAISNTVHARGTGTGYGILGAYNFSKRTSVYAAFDNFNSDAANATSVGDRSITAVGIVHTF